jgi:hypothetical protein
VFKSFGLALVAALTLIAAPVMAQDDSSKPGAPEKVESAQHTQGQKEAPGVVQAAGAPCTVTDGYYAGEGDQKDEAGKSVKVKIYEAACKEGLGYLLIVPATGAAKYYDCISLAGAAGPKCRLPGDTDPKVELAPLVTAAGRTCSISNVRGMGATAKGDAFYEVACQGAVGFVLERHAGAGAEAVDCARTIGTNLECKFTSKAQLEAAETALLQGLVSQSGKPCTISGSRNLGTDSTGATYYEVGCGATPGYVIKASKEGAFVRAIDCANASGFAGGCKLTDTTAAETAESGLYTKLAKSAGFDCDVSKYRYIGTANKNDELVELACSNRADGALAIFPDDKNTPAIFYDCVRAGAVGQDCKLTSPSVVYDKYSAALAARGKSTCKVSDAAWIGTSTTDHTDFVETACSDGLPGWVVEMTKSGQAKSVLTCGEARGAGIACKLPGNQKH